MTPVSSQSNVQNSRPQAGSVLNCVKDISQLDKLEMDLWTNMRGLQSKMNCVRQSWKQSSKLS